jgi:hypothetical protein
MGSYVLGFQEIDQTQVAVVGGKGAHLGELSRIEGIRVPAGFCVTTDAFQRIMAEAPSIDERLDRLSRLKPDDREAIRALSAEIRGTVCLAKSGAGPSPVKAHRALAVPSNIHPRQRSGLQRQLAARGMLDGDLVILGQERNDFLEKLLIEIVVVGRIGENKVEGTSSFGGQSSEAGGQHQAADVHETLTETAGVGFQGLHGAQVVVHGERAQSAATDSLQGHGPTAGEEIENARTVDSIAPDREQRLANPSFGRACAGRHGEAPSAEVPAGDPDARFHRPLDTRAVKYCRR